ncbi:hypothetical protein GAG94_08505 [Lysinibacillus sphaericus]|nr:hypothetical protein GAG94_08505 [Lysinibacillus sphaericus]
MWNNNLENETLDEILELIIETYDVGFTKNFGVINSYLKPARVSKDIINQHKDSNNIVRDVINSLPNDDSTKRIVKSLLYRLLYIHFGDGETHYITRSGKEILDELVQLISRLEIHPVYLDEIVHLGPLNLNEFNTCVNNATHLVQYVKDRDNLHERDVYERFNNILMGEIAEALVIKWLHQNNKYAESAVDKTSEQPDLGHDIYLKDLQGNTIKCSVKSSLAAFRSPKEILLESKLASTEKEIREVNIQVYFWYNLYPKDGHRITLPNTNNVALFSWAGNNDIERFKSYKTEQREAPEIPLCELRKMRDLLELIQ